jgi:hypothetical protein
MDLIAFFKHSMSNYILIVTIILVQFVAVLSAILLLARITHMILAKHINSIRKKIEPLLEKYLVSSDISILNSFKKYNFIKSAFLKKTLIYRSFSESHDVISRLAKAYEFFGFSDRDIKKTGSLLWFNRAEAARCLGQLRIYKAGERLIKLLQDKSLQVKLIAAWSLGRIGSEDCIIPSMEALIETSRMAGLRLSSTVFEIGEKAVPVLIKSLAHADPDVCILAVHLLGEMKPSEAVRPLMHIADNHKNNEARIAAFKALGNIGDKHALSCLSGGLQSDSWVIRAQAVLALGKIASSETTEAIKNMLFDKKWWVRYNAGKALFIMGTIGREALDSVSHKTGNAKDMALQWMSEYDV